LLDESGDDLVGVTLNNTYAVERALGEGGMGRVYEARHTRIAQKRVAVKVLHPEFLGNAEVLARFQREAETGAAISHPNVVTVLDVDRTPHGLPYLVCEYLQGLDLADHLKKAGRLQVATATHIARQICRGLGAAHERGVIHRDLKPHNIFLVGDFSNGVPERPFVKLLDFGLSRFLDGQEADALTKAGHIMGTPAYMAPEQASGDRVDARADIYGVGTILYVSLTGQPPFSGETLQATLLAALNAEPPRPRSIEPSIPPHVEIVIERAMAKLPADRYQTMTELEEALESIGATVTLAPPADESPPSTRRAAASIHDPDVSGARPRLVLLLLAAVLVLVCTTATTVTGIELASGYAFNRVELALLLLAVFGTSITPALVWLVRVRKRVWDNSTRVIALLRQVRGALLTFVLTYGLGVIALHLVDDFVVRLFGQTRMRPVGATWPGWNLLMPSIALVLAVGGVWRRHLAVRVRSGVWRAMAIWMVTSLALIGAVGLVYLGLRWRAVAP
jgi:serine/threonine-protein kinase